MRDRLKKARAWQHPRSVVGLLLRAGVLEDYEARSRLARQLNRGRPGWNDDEPAVAEAACELSARQLFGSAPQAEEIAAFVAEIFAKTGPETIRADQMEQVIYVALGRADSLPADARPSALHLMQMTVAGYACIKLGLSEVAVDRLIADAERIAFERGWNPPLADFSDGGGVTADGAE